MTSATLDLRKIPYITTSSLATDSQDAIVILPDIWGVTNYSLGTMASMAKKYARPCYLLDYFYQLTGVPSKFEPDVDGAKATGLMDKLSGEDFIKIFSSALVEIKQSQPSLESVTVVGFCFGGRLAYLTGLSNQVNKIVSFYGAGARRANYYQGKTAIGALCQARANDTSLAVLAFYGTQDPSIPESDRKLTQQLLLSAGIVYRQSLHNANHAYFQPGRPSYDSASAQASWAILDAFMV